jgi:hypothetical protein
VLENDTVTGTASQFRAAGHNDPVLHRNDVEPLTLVATNLNKITFTGRAAGFGRHQDFDDARQMLR